MARFKELDEQGRAALAHIVNLRMGELGMHQAELKRASNVSELTIRQMQTGVGHGYRESTIAKVSVALFGDGTEILRRLSGYVIKDTPTTGAQAVGEMRHEMDATAAEYTEPILRLLEELFDEIKSLRDEVAELRGAERRKTTRAKAPKKERRRGRADEGPGFVTRLGLL